MFKTILLATHGTKGARSAEESAVRLAAEQGASLCCLHVINEDWKWMTGDDWLNTSASRNQFARHVENELNGEARIVIERVSRKAEEMALVFSSRTEVGNPTTVILKTAEEIGADLIVLGARQEKQDRGFKSRISWDKLMRLPSVPILVVPTTE